jgi:hypothetical protein
MAQAAPDSKQAAFLDRCVSWPATPMRMRS